MGNLLFSRQDTEPMFPGDNFNGGKSHHPEIVEYSIKGTEPGMVQGRIETTVDTKR